MMEEEVVLNAVEGDDGYRDGRNGVRGGGEDVEGGES
jgi:hypothetical protein